MKVLKFLIRDFHFKKTRKAFRLYFTMNLKEYSDTRNVSYNAVKKQIQRYKEYLGDNIFKQGRNLMLNEKAVEFLDSKQKCHVNVLYPENLIDELKKENNDLKDQVINLQNMVIGLQKNLVNALSKKPKKRFLFFKK